MKIGCVADFGPTAGIPGTNFGVAGTKYYANPADGTIAVTDVSHTVYIGATVEPDRLEVNVSPT
jgi:hypothetical protein